MSLNTHDVDVSMECARYMYLGSAFIYDLELHTAVIEKLKGSHPFPPYLY